jgi:hypothetical protein
MVPVIATTRMRRRAGRRITALIAAPAARAREVTAVYARIDCAYECFTPSTVRLDLSTDYGRTGIELSGRLAFAAK